MEGTDNTLTLRSTETLRDDLDVEALCDQIPPDYSVKGMFIGNMASLVKDQWSELEPKLVAPPRGGRYIPFKDYPQVDHFRLTVAAAVRRFPRVGTREAVRRRARDDFQVFGNSTVGKVMLAIAGDPKAALMRVPEAYRLTVKGQEVKAEELGEGVRLTFLRHFGSWEYSVGQVEGIALHFVRSVTTEIDDELDRQRLRLTLRW